MAETAEEGKVYQVLVMPLGCGVFGNPSIYTLIGLREAMRVVYRTFPDSKTKLDIKLLFWYGTKVGGTTDLEDFQNEIHGLEMIPANFIMSHQ